VSRGTTDSQSVRPSRASDVGNHQIGGLGLYPRTATITVSAKWLADHGFRSVTWAKECFSEEEAQRFRADAMLGRLPLITAVRFDRFGLPISLPRTEP